MVARPRVLQVAYACSPVQGSEPAVGWGWATQMARWYDVWVLVEKDRYGAAIARYLEEHGPIPHLTFVPVARPPLSARLNALPGLGYLAYNLWHQAAFREAQRLHAEVHFDLAHQVTFCGYREPGYLHRLGIPFIWGPVGGTQNFDWAFLRTLDFRGAVGEAVRNVANTLQLRLGWRIRQAAQGARRVLAANTTIRRDFRQALGVETDLLLETGVRRIEPVRPPRDPAQPFRILWSGELNAWKAMPLLLEALARLPKDLDYEVRVLGRGRLLEKWKHLAQRLGVAGRMQWLGWVPLEVALRQYAEVDLLAFTSLRETSGNVVLEALANGIPVVGLDHQGVRDMVDSTCGIKIPLSDPASVILALRDAILKLARDPALCRALGEGARQRAEYYHWDRQGERMHAIYETCLESPVVSPSLLLANGWKEAVKDVGKRVAGTLAVALRAVSRSPKNAIGILIYHRVANVTPGVPTPTMNVTPAQFRRQLKGLQAQGYAIWPLRRLLDTAKRGEPITGKVAVVTFDDGFGCVHEEAWPVLRKLGMPATIFLNTAYVGIDGPFPFDDWGVAYQGRLSPGSYRPLSVAQCRQMAADPAIEFGAHTHTHRDLRGQPDEFQRDLEMNLEQLRTNFGQQEITFAFPFGRRASGHSGDDLMQAARAAGVLCALTTEALPIEPGTDPFGWGRFNCYQWDTGRSLAAKIEGWYSWAPRLQDWFGRKSRAGAMHG